ncbi:hypothetical protein GOBAR_DD16781 [Gossypium barbadense]|nr:hypothetical protein GOBAR_DD16781 [Gossypium barbadense]
MPVYPRAFHFPVSRHSRGENSYSALLNVPRKDKMRSSRKNQASSSSGGGGGEGNQDVITDEEALSNITKQKAAATKQYIENHYKEQMKNLQDRKERYGFLILCLNFLIQKHEAGFAVEWSIDEHYILEDSLEKYKDEPSIMKYIKIAATLPDKTVRDVALRPMHEVTFSTEDKPKLLSQVVACFYLQFSHPLLVHSYQKMDFTKEAGLLPIGLIKNTCPMPYFRLGPPRKF